MRTKDENLIKNLNESGCKCIVIFDEITPMIQKIINETDINRVLISSPKDYLAEPIRVLANIKDKKDDSLNIIIDGGDWSGMWPLRVYMEPLLKMGIPDVPSIIYTPIILDWSGSKLSKRMHVGNEAYREYLKEGLINYSEFYNQYGEIGFERLYNEINSWILSPKKFIRDYTIEYIDASLKGDKINYI